jgi:branched-chain amino acid transport system ATP-binding protein
VRPHGSSPGDAEGPAGEPSGSVATGATGRAGGAWADGQALLQVDDIHTFYGSIEALKGITIEVLEGEIVTLIGSNGAGKSTTLRSISGIVPPKIGTIRFAGQEIQTLAGHEVAEIGIAHSPEGRRIFPRMTVLENLEMGAFTRRDQAAIREDIERVYSLFPRLQERQRQKGGTMSGGEQQMLAMGRALMARPRLLLLDEPSLGLAPVIVDKIYEIIREINEQGTTILLVEQNANYALDVSKRGYVLETGTIALSDKSEALRTDDRVKAAYLGA